MLESQVTGAAGKGAEDAPAAGSRKADAAAGGASARLSDGSIITLRSPRTAAAPPPADPAEALYYEGMAAYQHRHWDEALERFTLLKELQPSRPGLDALLDEVRWFLQLQAAAPALDASEESASGRGATLRGVGRTLSSWHKALLVVLAVLGVAGMLLVAFQGRLPWQPGANRETEELYNRGQARLAVGDYEGAQAAFQKMLEISPGDPEAQLGINRAQRQQVLAQGYAAAGAAIAEEDWERAGSELSAILAVDPSYADARARADFVAQRRRLASLYADGSRLYDLGQWEEALAQFEKVRGLDASYRTEAASEFLFVCYLNAGEALLTAQGADPDVVKRAVDYFGQALAIHPRNRIASDARRLGGLYLDARQAAAQGERTRARAQFDALLAEAPNYAGGEAMRQLYELTVADGRDALVAGDIPVALENFARAQGLPVSDTSAAQQGQALALAATPTPTPRPTVTTAPSPVPTPWASVPAGPISARSGPGSGYPIIGELSQDAKVAITGRREDGLWLRVCCTAQGAQGWVATRLLEVQGPLDQAEVVNAMPATPPASATIRVRPTSTPTLLSCVSGYVRDTAGGNGLRGWVVALQDATGATRTTRSNYAGLYRFGDVAPGSYVISISVADGWRPVSPQQSPIVIAPAAACLSVDFWNEREGAGPPPTPIR